MKIAITGASGGFGRAATKKLLARISPADLILISRSPAALEDLRAAGADVRRGDFDDEASLAPAFKGADRMLLISTLDVGRRGPQHLAAINAARDAGVRHIVYTSSDGAAPDNPAVIAPDHYQTEQHLKASGLDYTIMRDSLYAEAAADLMAPPAIAFGEWRTCAGDGRVGFIPRDDCVSCAVEVLLSDGHERRTYAIAGEETWSLGEVSAELERMFDRTIDFVPISVAQRDAELEAIGLPAHFEPGLFTPGFGSSARDDIVSYEHGIREGYFATTSKDARTLLGRPPVDLRTFLEQSRANILERSKAFS